MRDFQTRYGFCFFQLCGEYEEAEPVPGSLHAPIQSPRRLTSLANVGLSRAQLVPSCENGKRNTYYKYKTFKSTIHTELLSHLSPVILPHGHYDETIGWRLLRYLRQMAWQDETSDEVI